MPTSSPSPALRLRRANQSTHTTSSSPSPSPTLPTRRASRIRFYLVWIARILLPIVFLLSIARPVQPPPPPPSIPLTTAILLITHSRATYLSRTLTSLLSHHPGQHSFPLIISHDQQDAPYPAITNVIDNFLPNFTERSVPVFRWIHRNQYQQTNQDPPTLFVDDAAYRRIASHYHWALANVFANGVKGFQNIRRVIILEDDMIIASDFFEYFQALAPMLHTDTSLFCVSAWNDNGFQHLVKDHHQLHRTDFFPGLGWMLTKEVWQELDSKWPDKFWDDWMRHPNQTKGRQCIRPEVSRTANFGEHGVSQSFQYKNHVSKVVLAEQFVKFTDLDLSYLGQVEYEEMILNRLRKATRLQFSNYLTSRPQQNDVVAFYPQKYLEPIGKRLGIMADDRNGIRRTSYKGIIVVPWNGFWAFILAKEWKKPDGFEWEGDSCC